MTRRTFLALTPLAASGQEERQWLEVTLERRNPKGAWQTIEPGLILGSGDLVRFRFRASFPGFVYVVNYGTSGTSTLLYPTVETGRENRVQPETDYLVPATQTSFRVTGPAGHDIVYWIVSPVPLADEQAQRIVRPQRDYRPPKLIPRCDDAFLRARGDCVDTTAGPRSVADEKSLPPALNKLTPRELTIVQTDTKTRVSAASSFTRPFLYEYRLPHK